MRRPTEIRFERRKPALIGREKCREDEQNGQGEIVQIRRQTHLDLVPACGKARPVNAGENEAERAFAWRERCWSSPFLWDSSTGSSIALSWVRKLFSPTLN